MPTITLPDGNNINFPNKVTGLEIAEKISKSLAKQALIMSVNGELKDLYFEINSDSKVKIFTARVSRDDDGFQERLIKKWSKEHLGQELEVTCVKDLSMIELWDDKAMRVELNTGKLISLQPEESAI